METSLGFEPIQDESAKILILGSMPGQISITEHQYYAHPQNAFWPIMDSLLESRCGHDVAYHERILVLIKNHVAVWDVIAKCQRPGSLDANIIKQSVEVNDFATFFQSHKKIKAIFFNGGRAAAEFNKVVKFESRIPPIECFQLLSTSPANARYNFGEKLNNWSIINEFLSPK